MEFLGEVAKSCKDASLEKLGFFVDQGEQKAVEMAEVLLPTNIKKSFYRFKRPHRRPQCKIVHSCSLCIDFVSELKSKEKKNPRSVSQCEK